MENITFELEPFGKLDLDELDSIDDTYYYYFDSLDVINTTLELAVIGASHCACFIMIYAMTKFDYLKTRANMYILHYCICSILVFLVLPLYELLFELNIYEFNSHITLCYFYKIGGTAYVLMFSFSTMLSIDWLIVMFNVSWLEKYSQLQKYIIAVIYLLHTVEYIESVVPCFGVSRIFSNGLIMIEYFVMVVIVVSINCITYCKKISEECAKYRYLLKISTYILLSWSPFTVVYIVALDFIDHYLLFRTLDEVLGTLIKLIVASLPVVTAFWLDSCDSNFKKAFAVIFRRRQDDYCQENLDDDDESQLIRNEEVQNNHNIV